MAADRRRIKFFRGEMFARLNMSQADGSIFLFIHKALTGPSGLLPHKSKETGKVKQNFKILLRTQIKSILSIQNFVDFKFVPSFCKLTSA